MVLRRIETEIPTLEELRLPPIIQELAMTKRGLILFVGGTGTGKSTSLAAMIGYRNQHSSGHIITIEDPIEFVHEHAGCIVTQREVGVDTESFDVALKNTLRQAPDVILIGEIRNRQTMEYAVAFAETGHLVLATLHTVNAVQTMERIVSFYPPYQHHTVRLQLALVLEGVVSQRLVRRRLVPGRVPAVEVLMGTPTIKDMVLEGRTRELPQALEAGHAYYGTQTFNQSLVDLVRSGLIDVEDALAAADNPDELKLALRGITKGVNAAVAGEAPRTGHGAGTTPARR
jgi:twitching motility protein PilU